MKELKISISKVKGVESANISLPLEKGIYGIVGANGCGKSTLLQCIAKLVYSSSLNLLRKEDHTTDSYVSITIDNETAKWTHQKDNNKWELVAGFTELHVNGMYEGSLFYGTRFSDSTIIDKRKILKKDVVDADIYVKDQMSYILHGDKTHYRTLKRIINRRKAEQYNISNMPYFIETSMGLVSQYRMSSGECLLVSLLHFIYNSIERKSLPIDKTILMLVDEIELALHPIAVLRLLELLNELVKKHPTLVVYLSTHSSEVIKTIDPSNLYKVTLDNGVMSLESNCYPSYLIRDLYTFQGIDFLILVEDKLAKQFVDKVLMKHDLRINKLIQIIPVGGWSNVLELHKELIKTNLLGVNTRIISVLDGDVKNEASKHASEIIKLFLPIKSLEKYLFSVIYERKDLVMRKQINDKYFILKSLDSIVAEFNAENTKIPDNPDKHFYFKLKESLRARGLSEATFIDNLCDDILKVVDYASFKNTLRDKLS